MNKLNSKIEELESSIKDLKSLIAKQRKFASGPNILLDVELRFLQFPFIHYQNGYLLFLWHFYLAMP